MRSLSRAGLVALVASACSAARQEPGAPGGETTMDKHQHHATGTTEVKTYVPSPFDEIADGPTLTEVQLTETFSGDIRGESLVRVIQVVRKGGTLSFVGLQRVRGSVGGRSGSFLLQPSGTAAGKETHATWFVVPGSGTGELRGLRGEGGFQARLGEQGSFWLDYYFE